MLLPTNVSAISSLHPVKHARVTKTRSHHLRIHIFFAPHTPLLQISKARLLIVLFLDAPFFFQHINNTSHLCQLSLTYHTQPIPRLMTDSGIGSRTEFQTRLLFAFGIRRIGTRSDLNTVRSAIS